MKMLGRFSAIFNIIIVLTVIFLMIVSVLIWNFEKEGSFTEDVTFEVPKGAGINQVAKALYEQELISNELYFKLAAYYHRKENQIKFGEYSIPAQASLKEILEVLVDGKAIQLSVTIPEGLTSWEIVERLNAVEDLKGEITEIPPEGSLAPNTYAYTRDMDRQALIQQMTDAQNTILENAWVSRDKDIPIRSKEELLILASIVEKETGNAEERGVVSSVFNNRLRAGMKLQTDPTVIYGITEGKGPLGRGIRRSELEKETPFNTYVIVGLPPAPICNPGAASILAAARPEKTDYHYFVAKTLNPSDGHNFAVSLDEHNANVAEYRKAEQAAQ